MSTIEGILQCSICLGRLDALRRLPCEHDFCLKCLQNLPKRQCPVCRKRFHITQERLPVDFKLKELLDALKTAKSCGECGDRDNYSECPHCAKSYCSFCLQHHMKGVVLKRLHETEQMMLGYQNSDELMFACKSLIEESIRNVRSECIRIINARFDDALTKCNEYYCPTNSNFFKFNFYLYYVRRLRSNNFTNSVSTQKSEFTLANVSLLKLNADCLKYGMNDIVRILGEAEAHLKQLKGVVPALPPLFQEMAFPASAQDTVPASGDMEEIANYFRVRLRPIVFMSGSKNKDQCTQTECISGVEGGGRRKTDSEGGEGAVNWPPRVGTSSLPRAAKITRTRSIGKHVNTNLYLLSQQHPTADSVINDLTPSDDDNSYRNYSQSSYSTDTINTRPIQQDTRDISSMNYGVDRLSRLKELSVFSQLKLKSLAGDVTRNIMCPGENYIYVWDDGTATLHCIDLLSHNLNVTSLRSDDPPVFTVTDLVLDRKEQRMLLYGTEGLTYMCLDNTRNHDTTSGTSNCRGQVADIFNGREVKILKACWQPNSRGSRIYVLSSDARFIVFDLIKDEIMTESKLMAVSKNKVALGVLPVCFDMEVCISSLEMDTQRIVLLIGNGDIHVIEVQSFPKDVVISRISPALLVEPSGLELDSCLDACSISVIYTKPTTLVLATSSGLIYHCLLVRRDKSMIVSVLEMLEIDCPDPTSDLRLLREKSGYLVSHRTGLYRVHLPWLELLGDLKHLSESKLDEKIASVQQIVSTLAQGFVPLPSGDVCTINADGVLHIVKPSISNLAQQQTFLEEIQELLAKPNLQLLPEKMDENITEEENFTIMTTAMTSLKEHYVAKLNLARAAMVRKMADLTEERQKQNERLDALCLACSDLFVQHMSQMKKRSSTMFRYKQLLKRVLNVRRGIGIMLRSTPEPNDASSLTANANETTEECCSITNRKQLPSNTESERVGSPDEVSTVENDVRVVSDDDNNLSSEQDENSAHSGKRSEEGFEPSDKRLTVETTDEIVIPLSSDQDTDVDRDNVEYNTQQVSSVEQQAIPYDPKLPVATDVIDEFDGTLESKPERDANENADSYSNSVATESESDELYCVKYGGDPDGDDIASIEKENCEEPSSTHIHEALDIGTEEHVSSLIF